MAWIVCRKRARSGHLQFDDILEACEEESFCKKNEIGEGRVAHGGSVDFVIIIHCAVGDEGAFTRWQDEATTAEHLLRRHGARKHLFTGVTFQVLVQFVENK